MERNQRHRTLEDKLVNIGISALSVISAGLLIVFIGYSIGTFGKSKSKCQQSYHDPTHYINGERISRNSKSIDCRGFLGVEFADYNIARGEDSVKCDSVKYKQDKKLQN